MAAKDLNLNNETFKTLKRFLCLKKNKLKYAEVTGFKQQLNQGTSTDNKLNKKILLNFQAELLSRKK